jgi:hypothetical protein
LRNNNYSTEEAMAILPNCLKTELVITGFLSDWEKLVKEYDDVRGHAEVVKIMIVS